MSEELQKYLLIAAKVFLAIVVITIGYYITTRFVIYLLPFILAWLFSLLIEPLVKLFHNKFHLPRGFAAAFAVIIFLAAFSLLVTGIITTAFNEVSDLSANLPHYAVDAKIAIQHSLKSWEHFLGKLPDELSTIINNNIESFANSLGDKFKNLATTILSLISSFPSLLLFLIVTIISTFFISKDKEQIVAFISRQIPTSWRRKGKIVKRELLLSSFAYVRGELTVILILAITVFIGLLIIKARYALVIAIAIGLLEMIPVLGSATLLLWSLWTLFYIRDIGFGIGIFMVYLAVIVLRQIIEPRIVGHNIGVYPLVTLAAIYLGLRIFGVIGIFVGPLLVIAFRAFQHAGIVPAWKK